MRVLSSHPFFSSFSIIYFIWYVFVHIHLTIIDEILSDNFFKTNKKRSKLSAKWYIKKLSVQIKERKLISCGEKVCGCTCIIWVCVWKRWGKRVGNLAFTKVVLHYLFYIPSILPKGNGWWLSSYINIIIFYFFFYTQNINLSEYWIALYFQIVAFKVIIALPVLH